MVAPPKKNRLADFVIERKLIIIILLGATLVSFSLGPYSNWDSEVEFAAASSVVDSGLPYATPGNLINQPPVAFYINSLFLAIFGISYAAGVGAVTLFGVGTVFLVYEIGKSIYGNKVGLVAASLFALTPWHVVLSRSFLIDVQCLFFSLLALLLGIYAIRKASLKFTLISGIVFGIALLTKLFAIFALIPLALLFAHNFSGKFKKSLARIGLFIMPPFLMHYFWYEVVSKLGFFSVFTHTDFLSGSQGISPSPLFLLRFFLATPGVPILLAFCVSIMLAVWLRGFPTSTNFFDFALAASVLATAGANMFLVLNLGLWVPYVDPVKYDYQLLPSLCLIAASLGLRAFSVIRKDSFGSRWRKQLISLSFAGLVLLAGAIVLNFVSLLTLAGQDYLLFIVENEVGFSFTKVTSIFGQQTSIFIQILGLALIASVLLWATRENLLEITALIRRKRSSSS